MIRNYLVTALRNIFRQKGYTLINVSGLAIGIVSCLLIVFYVIDEFSYDRFHEKGNRIFRMYYDYISPNGEWFSGAIGPYRLADELNERYPEIEEVVRISFPMPLPVRYGENEFLEDNVMMADSNIFDVFSFNMLRGNPATALTEPFTSVISEEMAIKFFGEDDPLDKTLTLPTPAGEGEVRITGVFKTFPANSHIHPDMLASMSSADYIFNDRQKFNWGEGTVAYYLLLADKQDKDSLEAKFPALIEEVMSEGSSEHVRYWLQPLFDTHLKSNLRSDFESSGDIKTVYAFTTIALFILLIASINYMNLSTARSSRRSREVGLRKVVGGQRQQIINQFLSESILLVTLAMILAVFLGSILIPYFNTIAGKEFSSNALLSWQVLAGLLLAAIIIGFLAGSYPALFLSRYSPMKVLYKKAITGNSGLTLRKVLVVLQFSISIALIISTTVVFSQWRFLSNKKLGVNPENVLLIPRPSNSYNTFKQEVLKNPRILNVTSSNKKPTGGLSSNLGFKAEGLPEEESQSIKIVTVDFDFFETLENRIIGGRSFSEDYSMDSVSSFILNQTAVREIGWDKPMGKWFETSTLDPETNNWKTRRGIVVGVAEDFHFESIHNTIQPVCFFIDNFWSNWTSIRISSEDMNATIGFLETEYNKLNPDYPFEYSFYDDEIEALYESERRFFRLFIIFALLAIIIASLGILGLASYSAEQRTREIGIRKVSGSGIRQIILLITNEFTVLILIANLIAWPIAWYLMRNWLMGFPYKIKMGIHLFLLSALLALLIAMMTVIFQAWRAAIRNPAESLRYE